MKESIFNIRVYGIFINDNQELLITDEFRLNMNMTKFPGGGLQFGEGTIDCLKRECMEELGQEIEIIRHFYTTDYYQPNVLVTSTKQLISIYYMIKIPHPEKIKTTKIKFDFTQNIDGPQSFRWIPLSELSEDEFTFPIDKKVVGIIKQQVRQ
jgi:ADP-ribose pyrophosphatase YjhB (NUDIX family)